MKTKKLFKKALFGLFIVGLISIYSNDSFAQQVKKKVIRIIENDGKGEKIVKEYDITNNKQKYDSISREVRKKMKIERIKLDSLRDIIAHSMPHTIELPPIPDIPELPFIDLGFDDCTISHLDFNNDSDDDLNFFDHGFESIGDEDYNSFNFFVPSDETSRPKIFYREKEFENTGDLDKMLKDLEDGSFDPSKYSMKEIEKDKIKDFKTGGKGNVIVLKNSPKVFHSRSVRPKREFERQYRKFNHSGTGNWFYFNSDSLKNDKDSYFSIVTSDDNGSDNENVVIIKSKGKHGDYKYDIEESKSKQKRMIVIANDNGVTKFSFTNPSSEELKMIEKTGFAKVDETKLLPPESLFLIPQDVKDKFKITFKAGESGKVKVVLSDEKGKLLKTETFDYTKGKFEKEVEIKELNSGVYYIQAQLNNKTTTSKLKVTKE